MLLSNLKHAPPPPTSSAPTWSRLSEPCRSPSPIPKSDESRIDTSNQDCPPPTPSHRQPTQADASAQSTKKKSGRGGARPGAGRKRKTPSPRAGYGVVSLSTSSGLDSASSACATEAQGADDSSRPALARKTRSQSAADSASGASPSAGIVRVKSGRGGARPGAGRPPKSGKSGGSAGRGGVVKG